MQKFRRLRKLNQSVNLGGLIDSNIALQLIHQKFGDGYSRETLINDVTVSADESILGLISDNGLVATELYCFKQSDGMYKGIIIGATLNITDPVNEIYELQNYDCICLNPQEEDNKTISELKNQFKLGIDICNMYCTFQNNITSLDELFEQLNNN